MAKRIFTHSNNDFQAVLTKMMKNNGMTTNSEVVLTENPVTGEIIIGKETHSSGISEFPTEEKENYRLSNRYSEHCIYLKLTKAQADVIRWLENADLLDEDYDFYSMGKADFVEI